MRKSSFVLAVCALAAIASAQVLTVFEIKDPGARRLQQKNMAQLRAIAEDIQSHKFPYNFYLSLLLDIDEARQLRVPQSSIRFARYNSQIALEITGNYYASYSADLMDKNKRARKTFEDVILPILRAAVPPFANDDTVGSFAIEISHHVRRKVMGVNAENPENVVVVLPRAAAQHMVNATTPEQQQAAVLEGDVYVDADPIALWISGDQPPVLAADKKSPPKMKRKKSGAKGEEEDVALASLGTPPAAPDASVSPNLVKGTEFPVRLITPDTLKNLRDMHQARIERMLRDLDAQAHFVQYAPPAFIAFHQGAYLQVSVSTPLQVSGGSRYYLSALAFDEHITHLVRPMLAYFPENSSFDGINFSTTLKLANGGNAQAVEFFFPFQALRCFASYDCTGQQLIDSSFVLINGERAGLNLQSAEAVK